MCWWKIILSGCMHSHFSIWEHQCELRKHHSHLAKESPYQCSMKMCLVLLLQSSGYYQMPISSGNLHSSRTRFLKAGQDYRCLPAACMYWYKEPLLFISYSPRYLEWSYSAQGEECMSVWALPSELVWQYGAAHVPACWFSLRKQLACERKPTCMN